MLRRHGVHCRIKEEKYISKFLQPEEQEITTSHFVLLVMTDNKEGVCDVGYRKDLTTIHRIVVRPKLRVREGREISVFGNPASLFNMNHLFY